MDKYYRKWLLPISLPALILFFVVIVIPFLTGVLYSFTSWRGTYFAGGANGLRGWTVRSLGPGCYRGSGSKVDFISQTGDMKLDL